MTISVNRIIVSGNIANHPELLTTKKGTPLLSFPIAINNPVYRDGSWQSDPCFIDCTLFGPRAQAVNQLIGKGTHVVIDGTIRQVVWFKDDQRRSKHQILVNNIDIPYPPRSTKRGYSADNYSPRQTSNTSFGQGGEHFSTTQNSQIQNYGQ